MHVEMKERSSDWVPVEITLKFETKSELAAFLMLHNDSTMLDEVLDEQIKKHPNYRQFNPETVSAGVFVPYSLWSDLQDTLDI